MFLTKRTFFQDVVKSYWAKGGNPQNARKMPQNARKLPRNERKLRSGEPPQHGLDMRRVHVRANTFLQNERNFL